MNSKKGLKLETHPIGSGCLMIIGLVFTVKAVGYGLGSPREPGPGFVPFSAGIMMIFFAAVDLIINLKRGWIPLKALWDGTKWWRSGLVITALFVYCILLPYLGFILSSFPAMVFLISLGDKSKVKSTILFALLTTACFYILFQVLLESQLPKGFMGF